MAIINNLIVSGKAFLNGGIKFLRSLFIGNAPVLGDRVILIDGYNERKYYDSTLGRLTLPSYTSMVIFRGYNYTDSSVKYKLVQIVMDDVKDGQRLSILRDTSQSLPLYIPDGGGSSTSEGYIYNAVYTGVRPSRLNARLWGHNQTLDFMYYKGIWYMPLLY